MTSSSTSALYIFLQKSEKLVQTHAGRDVTCRILQYFLKFLVPVLNSYGNTEWKDRFQKLGANMSLTRMLLRYGKPLPVIRDIRDRYREHKKQPVSLFAMRTLSDLMLLVYFITDHPFYLQKVGMIKWTEEFLDTVDYWSNFVWLLNTFVDIYIDIKDLKDIQGEILKTQDQISKDSDVNQETRNAIETKVQDLKQQAFLKKLTIVQNIVDIPIIFHFMNDPRAGPKIAGLCGTFTSIIGIYKQWGA